MRKSQNFIGHMILKRETLFIFLVATHILIYNTVWIEQYSFYLNYGVKLLVIASLFIFFRYQKMSDSQTSVVFLYSMLLMYGLLIATLNQQFTLSFPLTLKYGSRILALIAILMVLNTNRYSDVVVKFPIFIGVILSIQSILLFIMITSGNAPEPSYTNMLGGMRNYGIWGFCPSIEWGYVPRVSSFFSEASNFAIFLEYPIILSLGYYKIYREKRYLFSLGVCLLCFILTFSWTGYFALIFGFLLFNMLKKKSIGKFVVFIFMIALVYSFHMYQKEAFIYNTAERNLIQHVLFSKYADAIRDPEGDIRGLYGGRVFSATEIIKLFFESPSGIGLLQNEDIDILNKYGKEDYSNIHVYGALWFWLLKTGLLGISIIVLIFYIIMRKMKTILSDKDDIHTYISIAFITISIHQLINGDWIDPMFLFVMALILAYKRRNYGGKCITARQLHV